MNAMDRPTIFISSTIYDFRDLRSAIKDHLETNGCRVLASEFNDFTKPLNKHSYQACLDTIAQADGKLAHERGGLDRLCLMSEREHAAGLSAPSTP